jgi:hypothetical protein
MIVMHLYLITFGTPDATRVLKPTQTPVTQKPDQKGRAYAWLGWRPARSG